MKSHEECAKLLAELLEASRLDIEAAENAVKAYNEQLYQIRQTKRLIERIDTWISQLD